MSDTNFSALTEVTEIADEDLFIFRDVSASAGPSGFRLINKASLAAELAAAGDTGWTPVHSVVSDGERRVMRLISYIGGSGDAPTDYINQYVGPSGYVSSAASATDIRGAAGSGEGGGGSGDPAPIEAAILIDRRDAGSAGGYITSGVWVSRPLSEVSFATSGISTVVAPKTFAATNGSPVLTSISTTGLVVGMQVYENSGGNGIPLGAVISSIGSGTITLSANYTGTTGSGKTARFGGFTIQDDGDYLIEWEFDCVGVGGAITRLINTVTGAEISRGTSGYSTSSSIPLSGSAKVTVTEPTMFEIQLRTTGSNGDNAMGQANNFGTGESNIFGTVEVVKLFAPISTLGLDQVTHLESPASRTQTTYDAVPQMSFPLLANTQYSFSFNGFFTTSNVGNGLGLKVLGPDGSSGHVGYQISTNAAGAKGYKWLSGNMGASAGTAMAFNTTGSAATNPIPFEINGVITTTEEGTLILQFRSEVASPNFVQLLPGTTGRVAVSTT